MENKKVLVLGLGTSGRHAAITATRLGAAVTAVDDHAGQPQQACRRELEEHGARVILGQGALTDPAGYDLLIASPGVPDDHVIIGDVRRRGIEVISELEFGWRLLGNPVVAVTGTNGKTTVTSMVEQVMDRPGRPAHACGNIGRPISAMWGQVEKGAVLVVEVSSFQLRGIVDFRPDAAVLLNVAPDHLDWHGGYPGYLESKARITLNQEAADFLVYNVDDAACSGIAQGSRSRTVPFGLLNSTGRGLWPGDGMVQAGHDLGGPFALMRIDEIGVRGPHNLINAMAAAGAALSMGESPGRVREALAAFSGLEHRMEDAGSIGQVRFYNDSKATNPHACMHAVGSFEEPMALVLGGRNKGLDFSELAARLAGSFSEGILRGVVLIGESAHNLKSAIREACCGTRLPVVHASGMEQAVTEAYWMVEGGGVVLFSPACASFDMYEDYAARGNSFKEQVDALRNKVAG